MNEITRPFHSEKDEYAFRYAVGRLEEQEANILIDSHNNGNNRQEAARLFAKAYGRIIP